MLQNIFGKNSNIVIGALHFPPMEGYEACPGFEVAKELALKDLDAFQAGGVDGVIFENNYDIPHSEFVSKEVENMMMRLGKELKEYATVPLGVSVLWNDYRAGLRIAKELGLGFIRVPVFVDEVKSRYGHIRGDAKAVIEYRKEIDAERVALFTDIHVKHSEILSGTTIDEAAHSAIENGSDGLIVTGKWTGDAPDFSDLQKVRKSAGDFPLTAGSGVNEDNVSGILKYCNAVIVSTALKEGEVVEGERDNLKGWDQRIDVGKVKRFMKRIKALS